MSFLLFLSCLLVMFVYEYNCRTEELRTAKRTSASTIAKPSTDLELRFISGEKVDFGHTDGDTSLRVNPDYFESYEIKTGADKLAQRNRRAFYAVMSGIAFGTETGLVCNPTEWWHWGRGGQLSARVSGQEPAYYSFPQ
jgi:D-alanyl-D-alanine dipeptidase